MLKYAVKKYYNEGSKVHQVVLAILLVIPAFSYGLGVGWLSPMGPRLMSEDTPAAEPINPEVISWMASAPYIVGTPAVFFFGYIVDMYGRKSSLIVTSFATVIAWSLKLYSTTPWVLITARSLLGFSVCGAYVVTPLYIKEISENSLRGTLGSLVILAQNLGNLLMYVMGEYFSYQAVLWICWGVPLLHILVFTTMPDTPSFLLKNGKFEDAKEAVAWLRCREPSDEAVAVELKLLLLELEQNKGHMWSNLKVLVTDSSTLRAFRITLILTLARELCGCLAVLHFASHIFSRASVGWVLTANQQAAVLGAVQFVGSCTASGLVERTGRKPLLGTTSFVSGLGMAALGTWFYTQDGTDSHVSWLPIAALCLCIYCDAAGLQPVPFVIMTEMFSFQLRGTVTSIVISLTCALASVGLRTFHILADNSGMHSIFWFFAAVCIISTVYVALCVPETKMRTIDEIYAEIGGQKKKDDLESADAVTIL